MLAIIPIPSQILNLLFKVRFKKRFKDANFIHPFSSISNSTKIGMGTNINGPCFITGKVKIGKYCAIAHNLRIRTTTHSIERAALQSNFNQKYNFDAIITEGEVEIGNSVWIGDNVTVLRGVKIADGAVIGAGAVVTKNVEPFEVVGGIPAKHIKFRFSPEVITALKDIEWWNWKEEKIRENKSFFNSNLSILTSEEIKNIIK